MPTVRELSALYENVLLGPRRGPDVCGTCFNFTAGYSPLLRLRARPRACSTRWRPISYSVAREQLHHALASYKRLDGDVARRLGAILAAILWRFLAEHETCLAHAAGDTSRLRPRHAPSRQATATRDEQPSPAPHRRRARRPDPRPPPPAAATAASTAVPPRTFSAAKFEATTALKGQTVLLIDDTWTTGASAQSAAATLKAAGAGPIAAVVIGRHLNREWHENDRRLRGIARPFDWDAVRTLCGTGRVRAARRG